MSHVESACLTNIWSLVRHPLTMYVLAIKTTSSMMEEDAKKLVNKAAQKLIHYDIPANSSLALVSYNNSSKVEGETYYGKSEGWSEREDG